MYYELFAKLVEISISKRPFAGHFNKGIFIKVVLLCHIRRESWRPSDL